MIVISRHVAIPDGELEITAIRAQGAGGQRALAAKGASRPLPMPGTGRFRAGIGPNKAAGRKGGMRRQGSKRG